MPDVLKNVLTENQIYLLPDELLGSLASITTDIAYRRIKEYLDNPESNEAVKRRVKAAYFEREAMYEYLTNEGLIAVSRELGQLSTYDINFDQSLDKLIKWKAALDDILNNEYAIAALPVRTTKDVNEFLEHLSDYLESDNGLGSDAGDLKQLYKNIKGNKSLFRDAPFRKVDTTCLKRIISNKDVYLLYQDALAFLIEMKESKVETREWRHL